MAKGKNKRKPRVFGKYVYTPKGSTVIHRFARPPQDKKAGR